jgi:hypothetical protein
MKRVKGPRRPAISFAPQPPLSADAQKLAKFVDEQDTRCRKEILLKVSRMCEQIYREKGRAGWSGDIAQLRVRIASLEHELATVSYIH